MPRPFSTLENPFAEPKQRKTDDPALVGKILGADAEKAMRGAVGKAEIQKPELKADFNLTDVENARIAEEEKRRDIPRARRDLLAWAKEIDKDEDWVNEKFIIHPDGTIITEGSLELHFNKKVTKLPDGLSEVAGTLNLYATGIVSLKGFHDCEISGNLVLSYTPIISLEGLPQNIKGQLDLSIMRITSLHGMENVRVGNGINLSHTPITSLDGLPPPENIRGTIFFSDDQKVLVKEAGKKGYRVAIDRGP